MRVGIGYDVHRLVAGRSLILGGVAIPFEKGLLGHSDADVHAVCDALLGAAGLGDIGRHFPDSDERYKDISSIVLLRECHRMLREHGHALVNLDATIFAEAPRLAPFNEAMRRTLAEALTTAADCINIKATTTEGLGFVGKGEGMAAMCVVLIDHVEPK
jgi:2-C-methyl-D-erythritol 2,4-cyclodiphosphate synthase